MKKFLLLTVAVLAFVGCNNAFEDKGNAHQMITDLPNLIAAFDEDATRTYVEDNFYLRWHEGDLISAFLGNTLNNKYIFKGDTGDNSGTFSAVSSAELGSSYPLDNIFAIYPYYKNTEMSKAGVISTLLPAEQTYAEDSFGKGANTMVAVTKSTDDTFLAFKNVCGYLKIKLYGEATVKSIELSGNNGEKIAGAATITAVYGSAPTVAMADEATESITLDCGEGVALSTNTENPTEFWFVVPPTEFSKGVTIIATDTYGTTIEKSTSNDITVKRNEIQPMATVEVIFRDPMKLANNEIWYTSINQIILPEDKFQEWIDDGSIYFGANIVSKIYNDGKGIITFDGDVIRIPGFWFSRGDISNIHYLWGNLTSITIPNSVTSIGYWAFYECKSLTSITMPNSVEAIEGSAFCNCSSLTSITIPDSVTTIGDYAFSGCNSLTSVTIPDSVTTIGGGAFAGCSRLTSITIPDSVTTIGDNAFRNCDSLKEFKGKYATDDGRCLIIAGTLNSFATGCGATEYTIPDSVTTIGNDAFYGCKSLTGVTIPDSVTTIGRAAFAGCENLTSVTIPDSVTTIGGDAFYNCRNLTNVYITDLTTWCNIEFINSSSCPLGFGEKTNLYLNGELLTDLVIPDSVTTIGDWALSDCNNLTSVTIPDSVTTIGERAFASCDSLTSVTIGDSVTTIGDYAFASCGSLTSVIIGDSVTTIGDYAFCGCRSLTSVYCKATTPPSIGYAVFSDNANSRKIYVPTASVNAYKTAEGWSKYAYDIVGYDF